MPCLSSGFSSKAITQKKDLGDEVPGFGSARMMTNFRKTSQGFTGITAWSRPATHLPRGNLLTVWVRG